MIAQLAPTYGLSRSPIRLIFQKNPVTPVRFSLVSPGCRVCSNNGEWEMRGGNGEYCCHHLYVSSRPITLILFARDNIIVASPDRRQKFSAAYLAGKRRYILSVE